MPDYVIHIGPPKTASTYLQQIFTAGAEALRAAGVLYPLELGRPGHVELARLLAKPDAAQTCQALFDGFNASGAKVVLLSAEDLVTLQRPQARVLKGLIGEGRVTVVYYCRRWSDRMRSMWGERIKHGASMSLADFYAEAMAAPRKSSLINFGRRLRVWREVFGGKALRVVSLDTLKAEKRELGAHFITTFLGLDLPIAPVEGLANSSLDLVDTEIMRGLNRLHWARTGQKSGALRRGLMARRRRRPRAAGFELAACAAAIEADRSEIVFNEARPGLAAMHRDLFARFGAALVEPHPAQLFFEPVRAVLRAASGAWMEDAAARAELEAAYALLTAPSASAEPEAEHELEQESELEHEPEPGEEESADEDAVAAP